MKESITLRALDNLFSDKTLVHFVIIVTFLFLIRFLFKPVSKLTSNKWTATYWSALLACMLIFIFYAVIIYIMALVTKLRFGTSSHEADESLRLGSLMPAFAISAVVALIYLVYYWFQEKWINKIKKINMRPIAGALFILVCMNIVMGGNQLLQPMKLHGLLTALAIFTPATVGTALAFLVFNYYQYFDEVKMQARDLQIARMQQQLAQSQLDALSSKINPHFLYNSLNSIAGLSTEDSAKTKEMAIALSKLFRYNINREENSYASVKDELEMAVLYLEVEKIRFEEQLKYNVYVDPGIEDHLVPRHLLQPLVENAVKHGAGANGIEIDIAIKKHLNSIIFIIGDTGKAWGADFNPGYGLKSLYDKLDILAPGNYEIAFLNNPKQVQIQINELKTQA